MFTALWLLLTRGAGCVRRSVTPSSSSQRSWLANGTILRGWALAAQSQGEAGVAQIRQGLAVLTEAFEFVATTGERW